MAQRQELEAEIVGIDQRPFGRRQDVLYQVVMGEGDTLGIAGRARCVDQGQEIFGLNLGSPLPEQIL